MPAAPALRTRSAGEILDLSFQIYRSRWASMAAATAMLVFPLLLLEAVAPLDALDLLEALGNLFFMAASAAVVVIASEAYMGREVTASEAARAAGRRFFSVWGVTIIQGIVVFLGLLLFIVPGIIALVMTFGILQGVMVEGRSASEAFDRSRSLAAGHFKHVLLTSVLAFVIMIFAMAGIGIMIGLAVTDLRMTTLLLNVAMVAINPLAAVVGTVLYYDLRIRKEAFDVAMAAERLGEVPVQPVPLRSTGSGAASFCGGLSALRPSPAPAPGRR